MEETEKVRPIKIKLADPLILLPELTGNINLTGQICLLINGYEDKRRLRIE